MTEVGRVAQVVQRLSSKLKALSSNSSTTKKKKKKKKKKYTTGQNVWGKLTVEET
jgi:hypothetical protein